jgi:hypothetical protein
LIHSDGRTEVVHLVLIQSTVSTLKRRRILNLIQTDVRFSRLENEVWDDMNQLQSLSRATIPLQGHADEQSLLEDEKVLSEDFEAAWALLQIIAVEPAYLKPTTYNLFGLIRLGNCLSRSEPVRFPSQHLFHH